MNKRVDIFRYIMGEIQEAREMFLAECSPRMTGAGDVDGWSFHLVGYSTEPTTLFDNDPWCNVRIDVVASHHIFSIEMMMRLGYDYHNRHRHGLMYVMRALYSRIVADKHSFILPYPIPDIRGYGILECVVGHSLSPNIADSFGDIRAVITQPNMRQHYPADWLGDELDYGGYEYDEYEVELIYEIEEEW